MNPPTVLVEHPAGLAANDLDRYQAVLAEVDGYLNACPPPLQAIARPIFATLRQSDFSRVVALLPHWLTDLLPVPPETAHRLGVAHFYAWSYYHAQDQLLDGDAPAAILLVAHLALLRTVETYRAVGLAETPCWAEFERLTLTSAGVHALELATRFSDLAALEPERLAVFSLEFVMDRATPFYFNTVAQLQLAGVSPAQALHRDLLAALRHFAAARQLGDDATDWLEDLRAGRLNYVSARLLARLRRRGQAGAPDLERLAGYQLSDEAFWTEIERTTQRLSQAALDRLAAYGDCRLRALIRRQMAQHAEQWAAARVRRAELRAMFGLAEPPARG